MKCTGMGIIKRGIAVSLMALMACVNPLQNLSAGEAGDGGAPSVASSSAC